MSFSDTPDRVPAGEYEYVCRAMTFEKVEPTTHHPDEVLLLADGWVYIYADRTSTGLFVVYRRPRKVEVSIPVPVSVPASVPASVVIGMQSDFQTAFNKWLTACQEMCEKHRAEKFPTLEAKKLEPDEGRRYIRVCSILAGSTSAWAFIDKTNGDILKPASWKAPAKHARGNLFDPSGGMKWMGPYGPAYLRGPQVS